MNYFNDVPVGKWFVCNGNLYCKRSTRTAWLAFYNRIFYFRKWEQV